MSWRETAVLGTVLCGCQLLVSLDPSVEDEATDERCSDRIDNDEDGLLDCEELTCSQVVACETAIRPGFVQTLASTDEDIVWGMRTDHEGNILVTGVAAGEISIGGASYASVDQGASALTAAFGPLGNVRWVQRQGGGAWVAGRAVVTDSSGAVYVTGELDEPADFGGGVPLALPHGQRDAFLAKYDRDGQLLWHTFLGGPGNDSGLALDEDGGGGIAVAGTYSNRMVLGDNTCLSQGEADVFVARFKASGELVASTCFGSTGDDAPYGLASDASDNVVVVGGVNGTVDFGLGPVRANSGEDVFVAKLDAALGFALWGKIFGGSGMDRSRQVILRPSDGRVVVTGHFEELIQFVTGAASLETTGLGDVDAFVATLEGDDGEGVWATRLGGVGADAATGLALLGADSLVVTGFFYGEAGHGEFQLASHRAPSRDIFVTRLDARSGEVQGAWRFGGPGDDGGYLDYYGGSLVATGARGEVFLTGTFRNRIVLAPGMPLYNAQGSLGDPRTSDAFLMSFVP